jgi:hypothetical protein
MSESENVVTDLAGTPRPRLATSKSVAARLSSEDGRYIRDNFVTLDELCAERNCHPNGVRDLMAQGRLPQPAYLLDDGTEMVPADYLQLVVASGGTG